MKKTVGWILLILGILAIIGGLTSNVKSDIGVEVIGYAFKFALIIGGIVLISKENNSSQKTHAPRINLVKKSSYDITEMDDYTQLPEEIKRMNKREYYPELRNMVKDKSTINPQFSMLINDFIIPDNISFLKYFLNDTYYKKDYSEENKKFASPTLKNFADNIGSRAAGYPSWFYCIYPDVAKWYISGVGNSIIKKEFKEKLNYLTDVPQSEVFEEFLKTEFYNVSFGEDPSTKIKPEILRELIEIYKKNNPLLKFECECD